MIKLKNGYEIESDGKSYTLFKYVIQEKKMGVYRKPRNRFPFTLHCQVRYKAILIA